MDHPKNDIAPDALERMMGWTLYPDTLREIVDLSRETFGWYTKHALRCVEYPWIVEKCRPLGRRVLDVGAGVSPIPIFLAGKGGKQVTTVDYSTSVVPLERVAFRNEWGFLDYKAINENIRSFNIDIAAFEPDAQFDVIYSVSVIEHMPAEIRRKMIEVFGRIAAPDASVLLTIDLYGASMDLWNHDRGQVVEPRDVHGSLDSLLGELTGQGFTPEYLEFVRRAPAKQIFRDRRGGPEALS